MKKKRILLLMAILFGFCGWGFSASASELPAPQIINLNKEIKYCYLPSPTGIYAAGGSLYVTLKAGGVDVFDENYGLADAMTESADKIASYHKKTIVLLGGVLAYGNFSLTDISDFAVDGDTLLTANGAKINEYDLTAGDTPTLTASYDAAGEVLQLGEGGDFYTVDCSVNYEADAVYRLSGGANTLVTELTAKVERIIGLSDGFVLLSGGSLSRYAAAGGTYLVSHEYRSANVKDFAADDQSVYILTSTSNVEKMTLSDFTAPKTIIASASDEDYFYNRPASATTRFGKLIVCDRLNDRVALISDGGLDYLACSRPLAAAVDNDDNIYVLNAAGITKFTGGQIVGSLAVTGGKDLKTDSAGKIYLLGQDGYTVYGSDLIKTGETQPAKLIAMRGGELAVYDGAKITQNGRELAAAAGIESFDVDLEDRVFALINGILKRCDNGVWTELGGAEGSIELSNIETAFVGYGDLIICDPNRHIVEKLGRASVGSADISDLYKVPVRSVEEEANAGGSNIVYTLVKPAKLFASPSESVILASLAVEDYVFVDNTVACPPELVYVLFDDDEAANLKGGYVYRSALSEPLPYIVGKDQNAKINNAGTSVYKWPSTYAPRIKNQNKNKNDMVTVLDFAVNYIDDYGEKWFNDAYGKKWYRIALEGGCEGFIKASDVSLNYYSDKKMPDTNAVITEYAMLYIYDAASKEYVAFNGNWIPKDTRVKIEVPFDSSKKYTKIIFTRDGYGTIDIDCFVESKYVKYDGIDLLQLVAIIIISLTVVLAAVLIIRRVRINKKRLQKARERDIDADI